MKKRFVFEVLLSASIVVVPTVFVKGIFYQDWSLVMGAVLGTPAWSSA